MPVHSCSVGGKKGWKWGNSGKCYTGKAAKQKAYIQGYVVIQSQKRAGKKPS